MSEQLALPEPVYTPVPTAFTVHTAVFDGPLDLLLYLVKRDGIPLSRVEVGRIAEAYLSWIDRLRSLDLSVAADFLFMAATLVHLKSLQLLPRLPTAVAEEEQDPRDALLAQLAAYDEVRRMAATLDGRPAVGVEVHLRPAEPEDRGPAPIAKGNVFALLDLYHEILLRGGPPEVRFEAENSGPDFESCCRRVLALLGGIGGSADLAHILGPLASRAVRVVTFVGILEMVRLQWLDLEQDRHLGPVTVMQRLDDEAIDWTVLTGHVEEEQMPLPLVPAERP
jgi:segregation and condensation protein A